MARPRISAFLKKFRSKLRGAHRALQQDLERARQRRDPTKWNPPYPSKKPVQRNNKRGRH